MTDSDNRNLDLLIEAADHLRSAIALLDEAGAPGQIGCNADLALNQLESLIPARALSRDTREATVRLGNG